MSAKICKQHYEQDCFLACITTAVQGDYAKLWEERVPHDPRFVTIGAHNFIQHMLDKGGIFGHSVEYAFNRAGLYVNKDYWFVSVPVGATDFVRQMLRARRAIIQVPSINFEGQTHIVYWDGEQVHDPSNKQEYRWLQSMSIQNVWLLRNPPHDR